MQRKISELMESIRTTPARRAEESPKSEKLSLVSFMESELGFWGNFMQNESSGGLVDKITDAVSGAVDTATEYVSKIFSGKPKISASQTDIATLASAIIAGIEGGYVRPDLVPAAEREVWKNSGETLFGLDRKAGADSTPEWAAFWAAVDAAKQKDPSKWVRNYTGGPDNKVLMDKAVSIIARRYAGMEKFLSPESKQIVDSDGRLKMMFVEAVYNGPGWFKKYADRLNADVASGVKDPSRLIQLQLQFRKNLGNSLIASRQGQLQGMMA